MIKTVTFNHFLILKFFLEVDMDFFLCSKVNPSAGSLALLHYFLQMS